MKENYDFSRGKRGAVVPVPSGKSKLTILIDDDLLEWFTERVDRAGGGDYLALINQALQEYRERENSRHSEGAIDESVTRS